MRRVLETTILGLIVVLGVLVIVLVLKALERL